MNKSLKSDLTGIKANLLEECYWAIKHAEDSLITTVFDTAVLHYDIDETADVPQLINKILVKPSSILHTLTLNDKLCTDLDKA